jgi:hypothetical protein
MGHAQTIEVTCTCGKRLAFAVRDAGRKGVCPACQRLFLIGAKPIEVADYDPATPPAPQRAPLQPPATARTPRRGKRRSHKRGVK